jgi:thiol-disulfide isomerase/thioredoxin
MTKSAIAAAAFMLIAAPLGAAPAPTVKASSIEQLAQPLPLPYDEKADAKADLARAIKSARREHKLLLIDMGGNWCPDCRVLAGIMELPEVKAFLKKHYVIVEVDVGRYDKNLDIADRYDAHYDKGAPAVLVVDPKTNQLVNKGRTLALRDARHMTPQGLADWLAQWT